MQSQYAQLIFLTTPLNDLEGRAHRRSRRGLSTLPAAARAVARDGVEQESVGHRRRSRRAHRRTRTGGQGCDAPASTRPRRTSAAWRARRATATGASTPAVTGSSPGAKRSLDLWRSLLPADQWISVPRRSAMLVDGHLRAVPARGRDLLTQMGFRSGLRGLSSLVWSRLRRGLRLVDDSASFREWGTDEFGRHWYDMFFDGYVRKTWLAEPEDMTSDWANQRIKPIGWQPPTKRGSPSDQDVFRYPRLGPGQLWEAAAAALADVGVVPSLNSRVVKARFDGDTWTVELQNGDTRHGDAMFSEHAAAVAGGRPGTRAAEAYSGGRRQPQAPLADHRRRRPSEALRHSLQLGVHARQRLSGRAGFRTTACGRAHSPQTDWKGTYLGLEYFIGPDGELWSASDESLSDIVEQTFAQLGIGDSAVEHVMIVRSQFAYPIYDPGREESVARIRDYLRRALPVASPDRTQRHAPLRQPGPCDVECHAQRRPILRRGRRPVAGEHRSPVSRIAGC